MEYPGRAKVIALGIRTIDARIAATVDVPDVQGGYIRLVEHSTIV